MDVHISVCWLSQSSSTNEKVAIRRHKLSSQIRSDAKVSLQGVAKQQHLIYPQQDVV